MARCCDESGRGAHSDGAGDTFGLRCDAELIKYPMDVRISAETGDAVRNGDDLRIVHLGLVLLGNRQGTEEGPHWPVTSTSCVSENRRSRARTVERTRPLAV